MPIYIVYILVANCLKLGDQYNQNYTQGRPKATTEREERNIVRLAQKKNYSIRNIVREIPKNLSFRTVERVLAVAPYFKWCKKMGQPPLSDSHKAARLEFAKQHMAWDDRKWRKIIFSDFRNLVGPDEFKYYWHDLRKKKEIFSQRQMGKICLIAHIFGIDSDPD
jgi:hypothetical protein